MPDEGRAARPDYRSTREEAFAVRSGDAEIRGHVHGERYDHAIEMLNAATEAGVPNRCNDNPPNTRYDPAQPERYRWEPDDSRMLDYLDQVASGQGW